MDRRHDSATHPCSRRLDYRQQQKDNSIVARLSLSFFHHFYLAETTYRNSNNINNSSSNPSIHPSTNSIQSYTTIVTMVSDPRVTPLLHRLGGLYRDPTRIDRDASFLLKSSVGVHLQPGIAPLVENNGQTSKCLVLQGTIAICFRGVTYQLLVDMFLPPGYPMRPPVVYVRLASPNMYLKENHAHVGRDGMVYLPYLSEWNQHSHNLVELVVAMSSVFSADPPVFTRTTTTTVVNAQHQAAVAATMATVMAQSVLPTTATATRVQQVPTMMTSMSSSSASAASRYYDDSPSRIQAQAEEILAKEAEEANRAAEIARLLEQQEQEQERQKLAQRQYEQQQLIKVKAQVTQKIRDHLQQQLSTSQRTLQDYWKDQHVLPQNERVLHNQVPALEQQKDDLEKAIAVVATQTRALEEWLLEANKENAATTTTTVSVDDLVVGSTKVEDQMIRLEAENMALSDLLYCLDRRMFNHDATKDNHHSNNSGVGGGDGGMMDCATFLKQVRQLAKRQFLVRAHQNKIKSSMNIMTNASF
jgi:ESCRT-I complex subunit TSG101